ncbi:MAG: isocitrate/isopropylmalate family dehydrogenase [Gemmataceae bacterium]
MAHKVVFVQGGGIGDLQEQAVRRVIEAMGVPIEWEVHRAGKEALDHGKPSLADEMFAAIKRTGIALKTKLLHPVGGGTENYNIHFRQSLGLFASVRPIHNFAGLPSRFENLDVLLVREITEDLYTAIEHVIVPGVVQSIKVVTEAACVRFFEFAFRLAAEEGKHTIHCIHKANILKQADGLFLDCFKRTAAKYPTIIAKDMIVDNACMQLVSKPQQFEMMVAGNLYGDLLSDLGAGLIGGISATAAISHGPGVRVYEAIHGGPLEAVGPDGANPLPLLTPTMHLLNDLGFVSEARNLRSAVEKMLQARQMRSADMGGKSGTKEITDAIIAAL